MLNLKTVILFTAVFAVAALSCSKNKEGTMLPDPIKNVISQENFCICYTTVDKYEWKSSTIYYIPISPMCCTTPGVTSFYNDKGEPIHNPEWSSWQQFFDEAKLVRNIYTCDPKNNPWQKN